MVMFILFIGHNIVEVLHSEFCIHTGVQSTELCFQLSFWFSVFLQGSIMQHSFFKAHFGCVELGAILFNVPSVKVLVRAPEAYMLPASSRLPGAFLHRLMLGKCFVHICG